MKRIFLLAAAFGLIFAGTAFAQVATTDLVPAAPVFIHPQATTFNGATITPDNPAALAWGGPSRIAVGASKATFKDNLGVNPTVDLDGMFAGARFVGDTFGVALETSKVDVKTTPALSADKSSDVQFSVGLGNWFAFGVGAGKSKSEAAGDDANSKSAGISLRLGNVFYVGVGGRQDENTHTDLFAPFSAKEKRNVTMAGVALRTEGDLRWYLAADSIRAKSFDYTAAPGGYLYGGFDKTTYTAQMIWNWFLLGASTSDLDVKDYGGGKPTVKSTTVDIGYAPMHGLTVTAHLIKTNVTDPSPADDTITTQSLAVAWLF